MTNLPEHHRGRLVVADDEHHIRTILASGLRGAGYLVHEARDGEEALEHLTRHSADLLVTDLQMPCLSGLDLCHRLAADERTRATPVLMITARGYVLAPEELARTGIRALMSKPFAMREVLRRVDEILAPLAPPTPAAPDHPDAPARADARAA